jgi:Zn-dependent protease
VFGGFIFGWAKPVPVSYNRLRQPKRDMALVALAGPASNLLMALGWALVALIGHGLQTDALCRGWASRCC